MRPRPAVSSVAALASIVVCAAAGPAPAPSAPPGAAGPERRLTLTERRPAGARGRWFVAFQEEPLPTPGSEKPLGPSSRGAADVDCSAAQFRIAAFTAFAGPKFTGAVLLDLGQRTEWRSPEPGTVMDRVLAAACGPMKAGARGGAPDAVGAPVQPPPPGPPPPDEAAAPAAGGVFYVQLAALPSADAARRAWDELKRAAPGILDDRLRRLTVATVHGRRVYRVLAGGFGSTAQAETVCKALARLSAQCFVRPVGAPGEPTLRLASHS